MSLINGEDLQLLGLSSATIAGENSIVDNTESTSNEVKKFKLDIVADGTLKSKRAIVSLISAETARTELTITKNFKLVPESILFNAQVQKRIPLFGQLSFCDLSKVENKLINNANYFNQFVDFSNKNLESLRFKGTNESFPYARFSFESGVKNQNILSGFSFDKTGLISTSTTFNLTGIFSGRNSISTVNFVNWKKNQLPGESTTTLLNNFYLTYPTTVSVNNFNAYNIPTKLTCFMKKTPVDQKDLKGIILISTGIGQNERICYISPHKAETGLCNTLVHALQKQTITRQKDFVYPIPKIINTRITSGIAVKSIFATSENIQGIFPSGIRLFKPEQDTSVFNKYNYSGYMTNDTGSFYPKNWYHPYRIDSDGHLKQNTPITGTAFYQMYSGLYTASKKFNKGTWDGIIPSGTPFSVELINPLFNTEVGTDHMLYVVYSGYGNYDPIDSKINQTISAFNFNKVFGNINDLNVQVYQGNLLGVLGRGEDAVKEKAIQKAQQNAKFLLYSQISNILKNYLPEILFLNKNLKKFIKFQQKFKQKFKNLTFNNKSINTNPDTTQLPTLTE